MLEILREPVTGTGSAAATVAPVPPPRRRRQDEVTAELAHCLKRFLSASADEPTMERARRALEAWDRLCASEAAGGTEAGGVVVVHDGTGWGPAPRPVIRKRS